MNHRVGNLIYSRKKPIDGEFSEEDSWWWWGGEENMINILIVDDDIIWTKSMMRFLNNEDNFYIVGIAQNKEEAIHLTRTLDINVVLMDINLTENIYDGINAAAEIFEIKKVKIIMLSSLTGDDEVIKSFAAGAVNFVSKMQFKEIPAFIRSAVNEFSPMEVLLNEHHRLLKEETLKKLTSAEREIMDLIEQGNTYTEIENKLFKSSQTIKNQINSLLKKIGAKTVKEAIKKVKKKVF